MRIFINAGHWDDPVTKAVEDPGAQVPDPHDEDADQDFFHSEGEIVMAVRDFIRQKHPEYLYVPDNLNLRRSIDWVNERAEPGDIAIDLHMNSNRNTSVTGCEAYYADNPPKLAEIFSRHVAEELGIANRGAKHDSETYVGSLGWLRQIKCKTVLVELAFLSSPIDRNKILWPSGKQKAAKAIIDAIREARGLTEYVPDVEERVRVLLKRIVELLQAIIRIKTNQT